ncbi:MAG: methyltransferase [Clostridia bacterium]|nr:methyltransferase [Clostridia bacterium]
MVELKNNERIDDLECNGYKIIQDKDGYCFTSDSIILTNLVNAHTNDSVVDLCTGSGVIALLLSAKHRLKKVYGIEIQKRLADMASRSVKLNNDDIVEIVNDNLINISQKIGKETFDIVTCNPPYEEKYEKKDEYSEIDICKNEINVSLSEIIKEGSRLLKFGGLFYMIHRARRLVDVIVLFRKFNLEPKNIYFIYPKANKNCDTFIIVGKKGANPSVVIPKPLVVYDDNGEYTEEVKALYNKK